jgi:hypothetical protein
MFVKLITLLNHFDNRSSFPRFFSCHFVPNLNFYLGLNGKDWLLSWELLSAEVLALIHLSPQKLVNYQQGSGLYLRYSLAFSYLCPPFSSCTGSETSLVSGAGFASTDLFMIKLPVETLNHSCSLN